MIWHTRRIDEDTFAMTIENDDGTNAFMADVTRDDIIAIIKALQASLALLDEPIEKDEIANIFLSGMSRDGLIKVINYLQALLAESEESPMKHR